ncbi:MAG TPA: gamma-glutamyltransferase [Terriglobales bacterium]|nr:gamma-glutamyltransferase [Terriglobales bacterium]
MRTLPRSSLLFAIALTVGLATASAADKVPVRAPHAMVASGHELASRAGVEVMQKGGNAVDAAVATGFALAVVLPEAGNLGGGGFMLLRLADGTTRFLDFREKAPAAASREMYLDIKGNVLPDASVVGYRAIAVPGTVAGLVDAEKKFGKLTLAQVMAPAIRLAREGFVLSARDARQLHDPSLATFPESRRIFQRDGRYYQPGDIFKQPELARTLERIAADPESFYHGALGGKLAASIQTGGGLITARDLAAYEVKEREPVHGSYRGYEIIAAPPPSSGGIALIEALNILEGYDLAKLAQGSAESVHLMAEAFRRAFFDRAELLGDPDFASLPVATLIDKHYAAAWRESLDPRRASPSAGLRRPVQVFDKLDRVASSREPDHTTHYSVVDSAGNAVAVTTTLNDVFGSRVTAKGLGFLLNDEMDDFTAKPGAPNMFGLLQGEANAIAPGKRPLSAMSPTIVLKDGGLFMVLGSRGGPRIITAVAEVLVNVIDYGMNIQQAVDTPRFHHQWMPDVLRIEKDGLSAATGNRLAAMGHRIEEGYTERKQWHARWGDVECVAVDRKTGERLGASDSRTDGKAVGY